MEGVIMFDGAFDFNPLEVGNPMTLGFIEENISKSFVDCTPSIEYSLCIFEDDSDDDDDDDYPYVRL